MPTHRQLMGEDWRFNIEAPRWLMRIQATCFLDSVYLYLGDLSELRGVNTDDAMCLIRGAALEIAAEEEIENLKVNS